MDVTTCKLNFVFLFLCNQAAALAACQFLANEASRPAEPPTPAVPENGHRPEQEKPNPQSSSKKPSKSKHLQKKKARTRRPTPPPLPTPPLIQQLVEMGFSRSRAEYALKELAEEEEPRAELVVAWLIDHPDIEVSMCSLIPVVRVLRQCQLRCRRKSIFLPDLPLSHIVFYSRGLSTCVDARSLQLNRILLLSGSRGCRTPGRAAGVDIK